MNDRQRLALQAMRVAGAFICVYRKKYQLLPSAQVVRLTHREVEELYDLGHLYVRKLCEWELRLAVCHKLKVTHGLFTMEKQPDKGIKAREKPKPRAVDPDSLQ